MSDRQDLYAKAQRRLVASLLYDSTEIARVLETLTVDDVEEPAYNLVFAAIAELARSNLAISDISVGSVLEDQGNLRKAGGPAGLFTLLTEGRTYLLDAPVTVYAKIVKEAAIKASIRRELTKSTSLFKDDSGTLASDGVNELQGYLNEQLLRMSDDSTTTKLAEHSSSYLDILAERAETARRNAENDGLQGIPSMLPSLNKYTNGWRPGNLITIGAGTGIGKSVLAINCAVAAVMSGKTVMFFSLEMDQHQVMDRVISSMSGVRLNSLKRGELTEEEQEILPKTLEDARNMKLIVDDESKITVDGIRARSIRQSQSADGLDMVIVDYLQLVTPTGRFNSRQEAVADMSRNMKLLAKQLGVPVLTLVQLNRKAGEDDGLPTVDNIRESASIGQDSDIVILLHRDQTADEATPHTLVLLAKNRDGESNKIVRCHTLLEYATFREVTKVEDAVDLDQELSSDSSPFGEDDDLGLGDFDDIDDDFDLEL